MKSLPILTLLTLTVGLAGCMNYSGCRSVPGSGHVISETRSVNGFDRVAIAGSGRLTIVQGTEESLTIQADDNLLPLIETKVSGGTLSIGPREVNLQPSSPILYQLKLKNLRALQLSGSLHAQCDQLATDRLSVQVSGSGKVMIGKFEAKQLEGELSGSGEILVAGRVDEQKLAVSGSGHYEGAELASSVTDAQISGSGSLTVWARDSLSAQVSGSGHIGYYGGPKVGSRVSGSGGVRNLGAK